MNFIIFMPDEMQAEAAGCYGHPTVRTPNLDRLAAEGTRFEQCYIQHPVCSPSRCSLFTGWYPHTAGHRTLWYLLRPHEPNMFRYLKQAGYDVRWYGKNDLLAEESFPGSVTEAVSPDRPNHGPLVRNGPEDKWFDTFLGEAVPGGPEATGDYQSVQRGIDFLRGRPEGPFVLYLPLLFPHPIYGAPEPYHSMYRPEDVPDLRPPEPAGKPCFYEMIRRRRGLDRLDDADLRRIAAVYYGMCSYTDFLLGEVLKAVDEAGLGEDTTVLFTSDHGDWAGQYGLVEKWSNALDDTIARVPLVMRTPGGSAGHNVAEPVEHFDIMATLLELAGVEARHTHFARSLVPQLGGAPGDPRRAAFAEGGYGAHEPHCFEGKTSGDQAGRKPEHIYYQKGRLQQDHPESVCRAFMVRTATHKLIYRYHDTCELYDMRADPGELVNLHGNPAAAPAQRELYARLTEWLARTSGVTPRDEDPRGLPRGGFRE